MSGSPAIRLTAVTKSYDLYDHPRARLTVGFWRSLARAGWIPHFLRRIAQRTAEKHYQSFTAVRDLSFEVPRGEVVGIVGRNGSGKSTTLKMIAGTLQPTGGKVEVNGKVAALLELGSGFHPEFSGRENIYLNGALLGLSRKEIDAKCDEIAAFADIGQFLEHPVKTYSSGMVVRLAFAVHTAVEPDILIIDEALSVGDEPFRRKCFARLERLREQGTTILFVSHDLSSLIALTRTTLFFHEGEIVMRGVPKTVVNAYQQFCHAPRDRRPALIKEFRARQNEKPKLATKATGASTATQDATASEIDPDAELSNEALAHAFDPLLKPPAPVQFSRFGAQISDALIADDEGRDVNLLRRRRWYTFTYRVQFSEDVEEVSFAMLIKTLKGVELGGARSLPWHQFHPRFAQGTSHQLSFRFQCNLAPGIYFLNAGVEGLVNEHRSYLDRIIDAAVFRVLPEGELLPTGVIDFHIQPQLRALPITDDAIISR